MTTAEKIWEVFEEYQNFDEYVVPSSVDGRRSLISASCGIYNKFMRIIDDVNVSFDKSTDILDIELDDTKLEIFAKSMILKLSTDNYTDFVSSYGMNQTTMGFKDFNAQANHRLSLLKEIESDIVSIRFSITETVYE